MPAGCFQPFNLADIAVDYFLGFFDYMFFTAFVWQFSFQNKYCLVNGIGIYVVYDNNLSCLFVNHLKLIPPYVRYGKYLQKRIILYKKKGVAFLLHPSVNFGLNYWRTITLASRTPDAFEPVTVTVLPFAIDLRETVFPLMLSIIFVFELMKMLY